MLELVLVFLFLIPLEYLDLLCLVVQVQHVSYLFAGPFPVLHQILLLHHFQVLRNLQPDLVFELFMLYEVLEHSYLSFGSNEAVVIVYHVFEQVELFYSALDISESLLFLRKIEG